MPKMDKPTFGEMMVGADKPVVKAEREFRAKQQEEDEARKKRQEEDAANSAFFEKHGVHPSSTEGQKIKKREENAARANGGVKK